MTSNSHGAGTPAPIPIRTLAWTAAGIVVFVWGVNFVFAKHALNQFDVGPFNFLRFTGMVILGWLVLACIGGVRSIHRTDRPRLLEFGR